jgi:hypothetical protein
MQRVGEAGIQILASGRNVPKRAIRDCPLYGKQFGNTGFGCVPQAELQLDIQFD